MFELSHLQNFVNEVLIQNHHDKTVFGMWLFEETRKLRYYVALHRTYLSRVLLKDTFL